ncbi:MAG: MFS transporter [Desulfovibrio sp.]|nr:MFS transporter [Desulfovibrio sp.]
MSSTTLTSYEDAPVQAIQRKVARGTYMGQITDGFILGIVGIALSYAQKPLNLDPFWMGAIGSAMMFGIFFGSTIAGAVCDRIGRRPVFMLTMPAIILLSLAQFVMSDPFVLFCTRFCLGMVVGTDYTSGIALLNEWAPTEKKSPWLAWLLIMWTIGYCIAYICGFFIETLAKSLGDEVWRYVIISSAVPGIIALLVRFGTPESPKWLDSKGRSDEALKIVQQFLGQDYGLAVPDEKPASTSWFALFAPNQWRKTLVSGIFFFAQVLPFFAISIFIPMVLEGLHVENPHAGGVAYNVVTLVAVFIGLPLVSLLSRRFYLAFTFWGSAALLVLLIVWKSMPAQMLLIVVCALAFVLSLSIVLEFLYPAELFPTELRGSGVGLTITISRFGAGGGTFLLPIITANWGIDASLWVCCAALVFGAVICQMWAPETNPRFMKKNA